MSKNRGASFGMSSSRQQHAQSRAVENVVSQDKRDAVVGDEFSTDDESLGQPFGLGLHGILNFQADRSAVAQQPLEAADVVRSRNDQDFADAGLHQHGKRIINHRLVVN